MSQQAVSIPAVAASTAPSLVRYSALCASCQLRCSSRGSRPRNRRAISPTAEKAGMVVSPVVASPPAGMALVRLDLDQDPVLPRVAQDEGLDAIDSHGHRPAG